MNKYLRVETTTGLYLYNPSEWEDWNVGEHFFIVEKSDNSRDMYNINHVISIRQKEDINL